jgi:hypothetical protein
MQKLSFIILLLICGLNFAQSPHGKNFDIDCEECHSTDKWDIDYKQLKFNHSVTEFELVGQHSTLDCRTCHTTILFSEIDNQCASCHTDIHQNSVGNNCEQCHTSQSWLVKNIKELHMMSRFPLEGTHKLANCIDCHSSVNNLVFEPLGVECIDCHLVDFQSAKQPDHIAAGFSNECQDCHQVNDLAWSKASVSHDFFPLIGGHSLSNCFDCHSQNTFEGLTQDCYSCHQNDFISSTEPNHISAGFATDCEQCHTTNPNWRPASFKDHDNFFQLVGAHKIIENDCSKCHETGYSGTSNQCYGCHQNNYDNTANPSHQSAGFGTDCETCHNSNAWEPASFDHDIQFFPIYSGKHNNEWNECSDCHTNSSNYQVFECITCHEHNQTDMNDKHSGINGYVYESSACLACHPTGTEDGFNHSTTNFPLTGAHTTQECLSCHQNGYSNTPSECSACHNKDYDSSVEPNHSLAGIANSCEECHTTISWKPSNFNHSSTGFELIGGHNLTQCSDCHSVSTADAKSECFVCHESNYNSAPEHTSQSYPKTCEDCHNTTNWEETTFDHNKTQFVLTGAHIGVNCSDCHTSGYSGTSTICSDCHIADFNNSSNPNHSNLSLSKNCEDCHSTNPDWEPASFSVHNDFYVLQGAHSSISSDCATCHNGNYNNTPDQCYDCHQTDYNSTTDPAHQSSGFGTSCEDCHSQNAWEPATFDHDGQYFPIYSGKHREKWDNCSDCHTNQSNFSQFSCLECHEHNQTDMDNDHKDENDYVYESGACLDCHPNGNSNTSLQRILRKIKEVR